MTASPMANGFYGAAGVSRFIPDAYAVVVNELLARMPPNKCEIFEYERTGWTYHQKGLWLHPSPTAPPALTVIGSSNFGHRSVYRDLEAQLCIATNNQDLRQRMHNECQRSTTQYTHKVTNDTFRRPGRSLSRTIRFVSRLIRPWM